MSIQTWDETAARQEDFLRVLAEERERQRQEQCPRDIGGQRVTVPPTTTPAPES